VADTLPETTRSCAKALSTKTSEKHTSKNFFMLFWLVKNFDSTRLKRIHFDSKRYYVKSLGNQKSMKPPYRIK
jgi:hypothetical protein